MHCHRYMVRCDFQPLPKTRTHRAKRHSSGIVFATLSPNGSLAYWEELSELQPKPCTYIYTPVLHSWVLHQLQTHTTKCYTGWLVTGGCDRWFLARKQEGVPLLPLTPSERGITVQRLVNGRACIQTPSGPPGLISWLLKNLLYCIVSWLVWSLLEFSQCVYRGVCVCVLHNIA